MPEQIMEKIKKNISPVWRVCFLSALVMGLVAHLYKVTNWIPNWDSLVFRYDAQNMLALGRWFLPIACGMSSFYDLPWISGLMAILFYGLGAVCICKIFDVKKKITAALVGAVIVTFPTVTSVMLYNYVADGYALAFLLSCMAAMILVKEKPCYWGAVVLIALSAGIYQAYITTTIVLLLLYLIFELLYQNTTLKKVFLLCGKFLLVGILGMGIYYLVLTILLKVTGTALLEYQGVDAAISFQKMDIIGALFVVKEAFVGQFFDVSNGLSLYVVIHGLMVTLSCLLYLNHVICQRLGAVKTLVLCVFVALLPVGASALCLVNQNIDYHNLMRMGFLVFYLLFILQYEKANLKCPKLNNIKFWVVLGISAVLIFQQVILANVCYHKLNMAYEKSYGTLIRITDRIEQTEGAEDCDKILVVGHLPESEAYSANLPPDMTGTTDGYIIRADDEVVGQSVFCSAINDYCGKDYQFVAGKEKKALLQKIEGKKLGNWPEKDAISVVDHVIVIKLGDEE